jgi:5'-nucleotidase
MSLLSSVSEVGRSLLDSIPVHVTSETAGGPTTTPTWSSSQDFNSDAFKAADFEDIGFLDSYDRLRACRFGAARNTSPVSEAAGVSPGSTDIGLLSLSSPNNRAIKSTEVNSVDNYEKAMKKEAEKSLPVIHPVVDGRLKDVAA